MKRVLKIELEVAVADLTKQERDECAEIECVAPKEIPRLKDIEPDELGQLIADMLCNASQQRELFEGSGLYANFVQGKLISSAWKD